jgi:hypothetical protein
MNYNILSIAQKNSARSKIMKGYFILIFGFLTIAVSAQGAIIGNFPALSKQMVKLVGFDGFNTHAIDSIVANDKGTVKCCWFNDRSRSKMY